MDVGRLNAPWVLAFLLIGCAFAHTATGAHQAVRFVQVDQNVRLEALDWGGSGKTLVLLAGSGNTARRPTT